MPEPDLPDHYATLGLDRQCTLAQIRNAYRLLAKRHHPDVNGGSAEAADQTRALNEAHDILSDPARRRAYDRELAGREDEQKPARGGRMERNIAQDVQVTIEQLLRGTIMSIHVNDPANPDGPETYEVEVPPESAPGSRIQVPRAGAFEGGFVRIRLRLRPSARFKAKGSDLRCDLRINARRAAEGGTEMVTGPLSKPVRVSIPARIGRGEVIRVPGEGLPKPRGGRGDLLVKIDYRPEVRTGTIARSKTSAAPRSWEW